MPKSTSAPILKASTTTKPARPRTTDVQAPRKLPPRMGKPPAPLHVPAAAHASTPARSGTKIDTLLKLMKAKSGATLDQLVRATGWQAHSVRGAISGTVKKKLGLNVQSARVDGMRVYRIGK